MIYIYYDNVVFEDVARGLLGYFNQFGVDVKICNKIESEYEHNQNTRTANESIFIMFGMNNYTGTVPKHYILYQLEQCPATVFDGDSEIKNQWFNQHYVKLMQNAVEIWDYSIRNIVELKKLRWDKSKPIPYMRYVPITYMSSLENDIDHSTTHEKLYDVFFYGGMNERREKIIKQLRDRGLRVIGDNMKIWRDERKKYIEQSKLVINIHYYERAILETTRLSYLLATKVFVISESSYDPLLDRDHQKSLVMCNTPDELVETCVYWSEPDNANELEKKRNEFFEHYTRSKNHYCYDMDLKIFNRYNKLSGLTNEQVKQRTRKILTKHPEVAQSTNNEQNGNIIIPRNDANDLRQLTHEDIVQLLKDYEQGEIVSDDDELPTVSILTPTYNKSEFFPLTVRNWLKINYPSDKLEWIIYDDSSKHYPSLKSHLPKNDKRIKYIRCEMVKGRMPISRKRNDCVKYSTGDILIHYDDDDFYFSDNVLIKVLILLKYKKDNISACGCTSYGSYNMKDDTSVMINTAYLSEASMAYTREFWKQQQFNENDHSYGEGVPFTDKRRSSLVTFPFYHNILVLNHHKNVTGDLREYKERTTDESTQSLQSLQNKNNSLLELLNTEEKRFLFKFSNNVIPHN